MTSQQTAERHLRNREVYARRIADILRIMHSETKEALAIAVAESKEDGITEELGPRICRLSAMTNNDKAAWDEAQSVVRKLVQTPRDKV